MLNYDLIVIGFGKAGKTLATKMNVSKDRFPTPSPPPGRG